MDPPPRAIWGFPKIRGTFLGVPIIRIIVYWGLYWGPLIYGKYYILAYWNRKWKLPVSAQALGFKS